MSMYEAGNITGKLNASIVTGIGSQWSDAKNGIGFGSILVVPGVGSVDLYQIIKVDSATQLTLSRNITKAFDNTPYGIIVAETNSTSSFANQLASQLAYYQEQMLGWQKILTGKGDVKLTAPDGSVVTVKSMSEVTAAILKLKSAATRDVGTSAGQVMEVGAFGLGTNSSNIGISRGNLSDYRVNSIYYAYAGDNGVTDSFAGNGTYLNMFGHPSGKYGFQLANSAHTTTSIGVRSIVNDVTGPWFHLYHTGYKPSYNDVDAISQKGGTYNGLWTLVRNSVPLALDSGGDPDKTSVYLLGQCNGEKMWYVGKSSTSPQVRIHNYQTNTAITLDSIANVLAPLYEKGYRVWSQGNTTVDANGFIKRASPICRLFNKMQHGALEVYAEDNMTIDGSCAINSEAKGVTAERIDIGIYRVSGSLGFAKSGWYIETPNDANGNKKVFVEYEQDDAGVITVKTFTPEFDNGKCVAGEPVDIPEGRWIDLRLAMPEAEEPLSEPIE